MMEESEEEEKKKGTWGKAAKVSLGVLGGLSLLMGYISAAGMKESEREVEARKPVDDFVAALVAYRFYTEGISREGCSQEK